jgi:transposase-like protein
MSGGIDQPTIELIAERVAAVLREQLQEIASELQNGDGSPRPLTVEEVADRFGVARSTVYAHWREWGGYKLGQGDRAPIRFDEASLRVPGGDERRPSAAAQRRPRPKLLTNNPTGTQMLDPGP